MNVSLPQDLSVYQLALSVEAPPQPLSLGLGTLLSMVRSQIDLLIEQQIAATLWVKLPPGKLWYSEIQRYYQQGISNAISINKIELTDKEDDTETTNILDRVSAFSESVSSYIQVESLPNSKLRREYFVMVLSPKFCSLILAYRPLKRRKNLTPGKANSRKNFLLPAITSFDGKVIQQVLDRLKQSIVPHSPSLVSTNLICPPISEPNLINQLLTKQIQHQDRMNRQITTKRLIKVKQQNRKLHETAQLKDECLSHVCQELRTPITHMKTALSLLNSPNLKVPQRQRYLQMLNTQCDRQNALICGVLDLVQLERQLERLPLEPVRLAELVPGVVSTYQPIAKEKGIMLAYTVPTDIPPVWCVSGGLRQIAINLLSNSIKFTPNGGEVWVRARVHNESVQLEFRDTGIGIAESEISKIFDRFYRVRSVAIDDSSGVGLGLTMVQLLLSRSGGSISVKSKLYEGSTFTVQFAIASENNQLITPIA
ncbi:ATPase [Scytonema hofmannii PCC 7110]|uniref:histidine kinase n=1 Tax=Scytonema hofmannii PCC 7110 TaxID=128403 RepID=A0A139XEN5_9CYAN|nr:DICT sensory domain-containing protein [Scytonema hofmannii]KYC43136.1 ATPase [Scytonema hofmannii PCC 7110]